MVAHRVPRTTRQSDSSAALFCRVCVCVCRSEDWGASKSTCVVSSFYVAGTVDTRALPVCLQPRLQEVRGKKTNTNIRTYPQHYASDVRNTTSESDIVYFMVLFYYFMSSRASFHNPQKISLGRNSREVLTSCRVQDLQNHFAALANATLVSPPWVQPCLHFAALYYIESDLRILGTSGSQSAGK